MFPNSVPKINISVPKALEPKYRFEFVLGAFTIAFCVGVWLLVWVALPS